MELSIHQKKRIRQGIIFAALLVFTIVWLLPIFGAVLTSIRTMDDIMNNGFWSLPKNVTFKNFFTAWSEGNLNTYLKNSFIITIPSLIGTLALSSLVGFALAKYKFKGNMFIYLMFVGGMLIPFQILLIPVFRLSNYLGIYNSYWGLIMIHTVFQMGFCSFFLRNYMITIPEELSEAARIDGASEFKIFYKIYMPLSLPAIAALATLEFTWIFNDYIWALVLLRDDRLKPVTAGLATLKGNFITSWSVLVAGAILATIPTIVVFVFLQKYFIRGLTMGSGK
ncbi:carbohydrate ABC transporter membrane protein 2 (CUT1 family) [Halanaerobium saccharolyticum]|uniref:Carbohydrate ABC transporter membrane protein 2 (CUT1 family) n=1 Tax=Halanaerobium saccharolyticum TaxID=43595 RepID=A0A4R6M150_9FIRM|nr:carbohydrate ABC transporter permease [Halanaerobium saccharolyticum]TDO94863.1 carbohydrate ABC transporter membrane protein 2 (CUT1 family) [Halanaerobium saccharolyticum]